MKIVRTTFFSLGSNVGNRLEHLQTAVDQLAERVGHIVRLSSVYRSSSWGYQGGEYLNLCVEVSTALSPELVLENILQIEKNLGRNRREKHAEKHNESYEDRILDIDLLLFEDEIIFYDDLKVPHPRMLERKFVLEPLSEIAPEFIHPIAKKSIQTCLENCPDQGRVEKVDQKINKPASILDKYNYIAIEGNIGSGKTSLARKMGDDFNAKLVLERFADNPFLPKFYADEERYAFPLEMSFLADRYHQLSDDLGQFDLFKNFIVSDYYIFKSLIFAQVTLPVEEFKLYRKMFDIMYKEIPKPDVYVYLYQDTERLLENIRKRGRTYEQSIKKQYLENIHQGYLSFIKSSEGLNPLIIDVSDMDFVANEKDYRSILNQILNFYK
jgi:2-amino-4-hydroxy-6-hydroxymethyldihydropteridine diphosphokinase